MCQPTGGGPQCTDDRPRDRSSPAGPCQVFARDRAVMGQRQARIEKQRDLEIAPQSADPSMRTAHLCGPLSSGLIGLGGADLLDSAHDCSSLLNPTSSVRAMIFASVADLAEACRDVPAGDAAAAAAVA